MAGKLTRTMKMIIVFLTAVLFVVSSCPASFAFEASVSDKDIEKCASCLLASVPEPMTGSVGGEWNVIALARSGCPVPHDYFEKYYKSVESRVAACGGQLNNRKYTEYSRLIIAITAIGKNPCNVAGCNLLTYLGDYSKTVAQGLNGSVWALTALDCGSYKVPENGNADIQATRQMYVDHILSYQLTNGGWNMAFRGGEGSADPDMTAMAVSALAGYTSQKPVKSAVERGIDCLSGMQDADGGYTGLGVQNSESCSQVIMALCKAGIPLTDTRFVKNNCTVLDALKSYRNTDGSFRHTLTGPVYSQMASEQGLCALIAAQQSQKENSITDSTSENTGNMTLNVRQLPVSGSNMVFPGSEGR